MRGKAKSALAHEIGITYRGYHKIELGLAEPKANTMIRLATALRCEVIDFYDVPKESGVYVVRYEDDECTQLIIEDAPHVLSAIRQLQNMRLMKQKVLGVFDAISQVLYIPDNDFLAKREYRRATKRVRELIVKLFEEKGLAIKEAVPIEFFSKYPAKFYYHRILDRKLFDGKERWLDEETGRVS
jgi:transcriptional regulator with XRE-family HTH domain